MQEQRSQPRPRASVVRRFATLLWVEADAFIKRRLFIALLLLIVGAAMAPLGPVALKLIVDRFTGGPPGSMSLALVLIALYVLSLWLPRCVGELRGWTYARAERRLYRKLSERLFAHVVRLPMRYHLDRQTGAVSQTIDQGLLGTQTVLNTVLFLFLPLAVQFAGAAVVLDRLD